MSDSKRRATRVYAAKNPEAVRSRTADWRARNPEHMRKKALDYKARNPVRIFYLNAKTSAKRKGIAFSLTRKDFEDMCATNTCAATGLPLRWPTCEAGNSRGPYSPSIDRKDPNNGYVRGNVRVVCWMYNAAKNNWSDEDVMLMAEALVSQKARQTCTNR